MLFENRFARHFGFFGDGRRHLGIFEGCGTGLPFSTDIGETTTGTSCC
jgi:hypothetical protein